MHKTETAPNASTSRLASHTLQGADFHHHLTPQRLTQFAKALRSAPSQEIVGQVVAAAEHDRRRLSLASWKALAARVRDSELGALLAEDPLTDHALRKQRGYAGDAALLDRIYFGLRDDYHHARSVSEVGRVVNSVIAAAPCAAAVRARRVRLARAVDEQAARRSGLRVASIACGYLPEATLSRAFVEGRVARLTCVDQDPGSTRQIAFRHEDNPAVAPVRASIARLIDGSLVLGEHDFVYCAGLYDYLPTPVAASLTERLFAALAPGGRLLIGNYATGMPQRGYMEAFADWWLIYREPCELRGLVDGVPFADLERVWVDTCETKCVHYLDVRKVGPDA